MAGAAGLEPVTSAVTGQRSKPVELRPRKNCGEKLINFFRFVNKYFCRTLLKNGLDFKNSQAI